METSAEHNTFQIPVPTSVSLEQDIAELATIALTDSTTTVFGEAKPE